MMPQNYPERPRHYYVELHCQTSCVLEDYVSKATNFAQTFSPVSIKVTEELDVLKGHKFVVIEFALFEQANYFAQKAEIILTGLTGKPKILAWIESGSLSCIWHNREVTIARQLKARLGGKREVRTPMGRIDLLTETQIIEIKKFKDWRTAIGQILIYSEFYPSHQKVVYLYDKKIPDNLEVITRACLRHGIVVEFELDLGWQYESEGGAK